MKKSKKDKKEMILHLILFAVVILVAISYFPVKKAVYADAVYADENDERFYSKQSVLYWFDRGKNFKNMSRIVETSSLVDRPKLIRSGRNYIGDYASETPVYYEVRIFKDQGYEIEGKSPLLELNSSFDPCKVKNYFAISYEELYWLEDEQSEQEEEYIVVPIVIMDWAPAYPIQRSGTLASILLPKRYLTIWDFIG